MRNDERPLDDGHLASDAIVVNANSCALADTSCVQNPTVAAFHVPVHHLTADTSLGQLIHATGAISQGNTITA